MNPNTHVTQSDQRKAAALLASVKRAEPGKPFVHIIAKPHSMNGANVYAERILKGQQTAVLADHVEAAKELIAALLALGYIVAFAVYVEAGRAFHTLVARDTREVA